MQTLRELRERIARLESEKAALLAEVEELREKVKLKASSLEDEVTQLRQEAESLREMLGSL